MVRAYCIKYGNFVTFDSTVNDCEEIVFGLMSLWVYNENLRTLEQILSHDKDFEFEPHVFTCLNWVVHLNKPSTFISLTKNFVNSYSRQFKI